ncbi:MAG: hypothetical protein HYT72_02115 [Candidatus Aenigmarchaeota archaeon]|nr:hypothetical protein [Candidatus Aenigmarchaeota archaeon]
MKTQKGALEILNVVLLTGLMLGVVTAVFIWGEPLIRKNEGVSVLHNSEIFISDLAGGIKNLVNHPGRMTVDVPPSPSPQIKTLMMFDAASKRLLLEVSGTSGTIYSPGGFILLGRNACTADEGISNQDEPQTLCARSEKVGENYITTYSLKFIQLNTEGVQSYRIDLTGNSNTVGEGHVIILENKGTKTELIDGKEVLKTKISVEMR